MRSGIFRFAYNHVFEEEDIVMGMGMGMGIPIRILGGSEFGKGGLAILSMEGWWVWGCLGGGEEEEKEEEDIRGDLEQV